MKFRVLAGLLLAMSVAPANAQTLNGAASKSAFIQSTFKYLKRHKAVSVYASTKPYCPTLCWWSSRPSSSANAKRGFASDMGRQMNASGFSSASINHCVQNSGFLLENGRLVSHPKNKRYTDLVQPAVMMVSNKSTGDVTAAPVLLETNSFDGRSWRVFDANFKRICTMNDGPNSALPMTCGGYGKLVGGFTKQSGNRYSLTMRNNRYDMMIMTRRPVAYVRRQFKQMLR